MLSTLFGNETVAKILLFLFVNRRCYGSQLKQVFSKALTPLQYILAKLEKNEVLISHFEGKIKVYQLNPSYPLLQELEELLKKQYLLLPSQEKKVLHYVQQTPKNAHALWQSRVLKDFWSCLKKVRRVNFFAKATKNGTSSILRGTGTVNVSLLNQDELLFYEEGRWGMAQNAIQFKNSFRWGYNREGGYFSLEHLRRGWNNPVFLFHLIPTSIDTLSSLESFSCGDDSYFGHLSRKGALFCFFWRVIGPSKNEDLKYYYLINN